MVPKIKGQARKQRLKTLLRVDSSKLFGEPDIRRILAHYLSRGLTAAQIADKYGVSLASVRGWLYKLGLVAQKPKASLIERLNSLGYTSWDEFFRRNMSMTHIDAAKMLDAHWTSISHWKRMWAEGKNV